MELVMSYIWSFNVGFEKIPAALKKGMEEEMEDSEEYTDSEDEDSSFISNKLSV